MPALTLSTARRHWDWWRHEGLGRVLEEKDVRWSRGPEAARRAAWVRANRAVPMSPSVVWVVGLQRSGTNMVMRAFARRPDVEVRNEDDRRAFHDYRLAAPSTVAAIVAASRSEALVFKPLCDSHRTPELLDELSPAGLGRALWVYRSVDGRVRSATSRFGDHARQALAAVADGRDDVWQGEGLPPDTLATLRSVDWDAVSSASAQAWLWWARNKLVLDLGLDRRDDVLVVSYDRLVADPVGEIARCWSFVGLDPVPGDSAGMAARGPSTVRVAIDPAARAACDGLAVALDELAGRAAQASAN